jgi:hypothetical protein
MSAQRTVLFHPLNHIGLGHINRLSVIALALREIDKNIRTPKWSHNGRESASIKVENYQKSALQVILFSGETFGLVTAR